jgi:8-oxo-dGTP diphosphatase
VVSAEAPALDARARVVRTVAAVIRDSEGRLLLVRKRGRDTFIQPGGKPERGEGELTALARELDEELGCRLRPDSARLLGRLEAPAVHEPGWTVRAAVYCVQIDGEPRAGAEIDELRWVALPPPEDLPVAPLSRTRIMPLLIAGA